MFLRKYWKPLISVFIVAIMGVGLYGYSESETPLVKAEKLILSEKYYEAILALEPSLMSEKKSEAQEQALWLAHQLAKKWELLIREGYWSPKSEAEKKYWQKVKAESTPRLNEMVGGDFWAEAMYYFGYDYGFLQRLIDEYPNTPKRPIAEYYLIRKGAVVLGYGPEAIQAYHAYIEKYEKTGRAEVYMAYLDLAHIHHGIWAALTFPKESDAGMWDGFGYEGSYSFQDPEKEKAAAAAHKAEALKYYARFHINPHGLRDNYNGYEVYGFKDETGYELLKKNAIFGWQFIFYGC